MHRLLLSSGSSVGSNSRRSALGRRWGFSALSLSALLGALCLTAPLSTPAAPREVPLRKVPKTAFPVLQKGDRLAICGDSITEQRMYSRILETYLTVCTPELSVRVRQYGWSGERADGFFERMQNDVLRFSPTVATTCYGMNDHRYRAYEPWIGELYRIHLDAVVRAFQSNEVRVVVGSPGPVGKVPSWVKDAGPTVEVLNKNLAEIRNLAGRVAREKRVAFADIFTPMYEAGFAAQAKYGTNYAVPGKDGVHPDWAGQLIMAYAFLDGLGLEGDIGTIRVNLGAEPGEGTQASFGHRVVRANGGKVTLVSTKYPFCAGPADLSQDNTVRSGMQWVPFMDRFNRLTLVVSGGRADNYRVTWGPETRTYSRSELRRGINLANDFVANPFSDAFKRVDEAVAAKQAYETKQIKSEFHGPAGKADMEGTARRTEAEREVLVKAIRDAFVPVEHSIEIVPVEGAR